ncbi:roundabout homolog 3-like isoform X2 [Haemaphysalis longicornis]
MASAYAWKFLAVVLLHHLYSGGAVMGEEAESETSTGSRDRPEFQLPMQNITATTRKRTSVNCTIVPLELYKTVRKPDDPKCIETKYLRVVNRDHKASLFTTKGRTYTLGIKYAEAEVNRPYSCKTDNNPVRSTRFFFDAAGGAVMGVEAESDMSTGATDTPEFQPPAQNLTLMTGRGDSAGCTIIHLKLYRFGYTRNDPRKIRTLHFQVILMDPKHSLLTLKGRSYMLTVQDGEAAAVRGSYLCRVNSDRMESTRFTIDVPDHFFKASAIPRSDLDAASTEELEATEVPPTSVILAGHTALLRCSLNFIAGHEVSWLKEDTGKVLAVGENVISNDSRVFLRDEANKSVNLLISNVRLEDSGIYACHLNSDPKEKLLFNLRVMDAPAVKTSSMKLSREQSQLVVTFQCTIHGTPYPFVYWSKDRNSLNVTGKNHEVTQNRHENGKLSTSLIMRNLGVDDMGIYRCHAENSLGSRSAHFAMNESIINSDPDAVTTSPNLNPVTTSPNLDAGPSFITPVKNITATLGQTVSLNCSVKIPEPHQILWKRFKGPQVISIGFIIIAPSDRYSVIHDDEGTHKLVIKDVRYEDSDTYSCLTTSNQMAQLDIFLDVVSM